LITIKVHTVFKDKKFWKFNNPTSKNLCSKGQLAKKKLFLQFSTLVHVIKHTTVDPPTPIDYLH
jgi:hypothetical protein